LDLATIHPDCRFLLAGGRHGVPGSLEVGRGFPFFGFPGMQGLASLRVAGARLLHLPCRVGGVGPQLRFALARVLELPLECGVFALERADALGCPLQCLLEAPHGLSVRGEARARLALGGGS
jgi:hypothetical protein